jgi:hypothetical protein
VAHHLLNFLLLFLQHIYGLCGTLRSRLILGMLARCKSFLITFFSADFSCCLSWEGQMG